MSRLKFALLVALTLALPISGCGEATEENAAICVAGEEELCQCDGGLNGTRQCLPSTLGYTQCDCFGGDDIVAPDSDGSTADVSDVVPDAAAPVDGGQDSVGPSPTDASDAQGASDAEVIPTDTALDGGSSSDAAFADTDAAMDVPVAEDISLDAESDVSLDTTEDVPDDSTEDADSGPVNVTCEADEDCDDDNPCTDEVCMVTAGVCVYDDMWTDGFPCDGDGDPCTVGDACAEGVCIPGEPLDCSGLNDTCAIGVCVPAGPDAAECAIAPANEGFPCDDSSVCTTDDACAGGLCTGGAVACAEDEDPCTDASCDPATGCLQAPAEDGALCDDGDVCTEEDACSEGACAGTPVSCPGDENSCTLDVCVPEEGGCTHLDQPEGTLCEDGQGCTLNDSCLEGVCQPGQVKACDSGDACAMDMCDFVTGQCASTLIVGCDAALTPCDPLLEAACDEGVCDPGTNACVPCLEANDCGVAGLTCSGKQCVPELGCEDVGDCALVGGLCDEATGLCVKCLADEDCLEGEVCTVGLCEATPPVICSEDACLGLSLFECADGGTAYLVPEGSCEDNNPCTDDYCSATLGCVHTDNAAPCDDEDACTSEDTCAFGSCAGTASVVCVDEDPCDGTLACDPASGQCVNGDPLLCDDSEPCNGVETCDPETGECLPGEPIDCDDGDLCNGVEGCDSETGECLPGQATECDDGLQCNGLETCDPLTGVCEPGTPIVCSDGEACNGFETCDPDLDACVDGEPIECSDGDPCNGVEECYGPGFCTAPDDVECADADLCNGEELCDPGTGLCVDGPALDCDDDDPCTNDYCTPEIGCSNIYIPACDDGLCDGVNCASPDACTLSVCNPSNGQCEESAVDCDDLDPCTVDSCDPDAEEGDDGCVNTLDPLCVPCTSDSDCDDGDICTIDACDPDTAICDFSGQLDCDDENDCSEDLCDPDSGCSHEVIKPCPGLACSFDFECSNDSACTIDTCEIPAGGNGTGACLHTPIECDDGDPCHVGVCDPESGLAGACVFDDLSCDDGNVCTLDSCDSGPNGGCVYEPNPCDDNDPCTTDSCDALTQECENIPFAGCQP